MERDIKKFSVFYNPSVRLVASFWFCSNPNKQNRFPWVNWLWGINERFFLGQTIPEILYTLCGPWKNLITFSFVILWIRDRLCALTLFGPWLWYENLTWAIQLKTDFCSTYIFVHSVLLLKQRNRERKWYWLDRGILCYYRVLNTTDARDLSVSTAWTKTHPCTIRS